jgi:WXXGXW repeat (2 copies)
MEKTLIGVVDRLRQFWGSVGVTPPLLVGLTLTGVRGWKVLHSPYWYNDLDGTVDRDVVAVPEVVLSDPAIDTDVLLRPIFDFVWNGGGWAGSPNYRDGRWVEPRR